MAELATSSHHQNLLI